MRRIAPLLALFAVTACSSGSGGSDAPPPPPDVTPPAAPVITAPVNGALSNATPLVLSGTAPLDATAIAIHDLSTPVTTTIPAAGAFSTPVAAGEGDHVFTAFAVDAAGNVSSTSNAVAVTIDRTPPPVPTVTAPASGAYLAVPDLVAGQVVVSGLADAGVTVEVLLDAAPLATVTASGGGTWSVSVSLASGSHVASARTRDAAGNASLPAPDVPFTVDLARQASPLPPGGPLPVTAWAQGVPVLPTDQSGIGEVFPGQANSWTLDRDFSLMPGFGQQYLQALVLYVGGLTTPPSHQDVFDAVFAGSIAPFPADQAADEVTFLTPRFGAGDGVVTAAGSDGGTIGIPPLTPLRSGYLNGTSDSRLSQRVSLACGTTCTFAWSHDADFFAGRLLGEDVPPRGPAFQVVLRDPGTGAQLGDPLFATTAEIVTPQSVSVSRSALPAEVVLSFELRSASWGFAEIDDVVVTDETGTFSPPNAGFEDAGLAPWIANPGAESQNVRGAPRDVGTSPSTLRVTRTFHAPPAASWGRMVDVFENPGATVVETDVVYLVNLAGDVPFAAPTPGRGAVVGWDGSALVRDVGIVHGSGTALVSTAGPLADPDAPYVFVVHHLSVPAGGRTALVHFVVQLGDTGGGMASSALPVNTAAECDAIAAGFRTVEAYRRDLEPGVLGLVQNL